MKRNILIICLALSVVFLSGCLNEKSLSPYSDPDNQGEWVLNGEVSDEFDGTELDLEKWRVLGYEGKYYGEWMGRAPSQFVSENVTVVDGFLTITTRWDPEYGFVDATFNNGYKYGEPAPITTGGIFSIAKFLYGYMEIRAMAADGPISSSFWSTGVGGEIDVFEHYGNAPGNPYSQRRYQSSFHDWRPGSPTMGHRIWTNIHQLDFRVADDFHIYGFEWDENYVKIFVDGMLINHVTKEEIGDDWVAYAEQKIWLDSETFNWEADPYSLTADDFGEGLEFIVDYVRIWQRGSESEITEQSPRPNILKNGGFESGMESWEGSAEITDDAHTGLKAAYFKTNGSMLQTVSVKPESTYILSAWAKSPGTNMADIWLDAYLEVEGRDITGSCVRFFMPEYQRRSCQFTTGSETNSVIVTFSNEPEGGTTMVDDIELVEMVNP